MITLTDYETATIALMLMEGERWLMEGNCGYGEHGLQWFYEYWLEHRGSVLPTESIRRGKPPSALYGYGGNHRYIILGSGEVCYSGSHGRSAISDAEALGFRIV